MIIVISNLLVGFSGAEPVRGREKERERRGGGGREGGERERDVYGRRPATGTGSHGRRAETSTLPPASWIGSRAVALAHTRGRVGGELRGREEVDVLVRERHCALPPFLLHSSLQGRLGGRRHSRARAALGSDPGTNTFADARGNHIHPSSTHPSAPAW